MVINVDELVRSLEKDNDGKDTPASVAIWVRFSNEKTERTIDFRTADGNQIVHVYIDRGNALVALEIFP
jgi:hypothetical protein